MKTWTAETLELRAKRLDDLSLAVAENLRNEFSMRVPAEPDRDADLVLQDAAEIIRAFAERIKAGEIAVPVGYVREWEGDVSDLGSMLFAENKDECDENPNWFPVYDHPPTQPSTSQAKVGEADVHRLLKDTLFACIATGKDQAVYGGVAYKGGAAKIAFSIEKPTADPELQGGDDDFETWFSKQDSRTEWLDLVRLAYAVQAEPAQAARSIALTDLLAAVDSFLKRPGPKIEGTNGAHICLGSYYRRMRNARKSMIATAPTQAKDSQ